MPMKRLKSQFQKKNEISRSLINYTFGRDKTHLSNNVFPLKLEKLTNKEIIFVLL